MDETNDRSRAEPSASSLPSPDDAVAIGDLFARYCTALDRDDVAACVALFADDGVFEVYGRRWTGHEELTAMMTAAPGGLHLGGAPVIEMTGTDRALTTQNLYFVPRDGAAPRGAYYTDELVRTSRGWRIAHRRCRFQTVDGLGDRPAS